MMFCAAIFAMLGAPAPASHAVVTRLDRLGAVATTIDGKGPYHFLIDTGAAITVITPQLSRRLGLLPRGRATANGAGGTEQVAKISLPTVRVGAAEERDVAAAVVALPPDLTYQGDYGTIDGLLGYSFLSRFAVTIDLRKHVLTLTPPRAYHRMPGAVSVAADISGGTPLVQARVDGIPGTFQLDTGDDGTLALTAAFTEKHGFARRYRRKVPTMFEGVGGIPQGDAVRLHRFELGGALLRNEIATLSFAKKGMLGGSALAGNVGIDVLRRFVFTVDYPHDRVDFLANAALQDYVPFTFPGDVAIRQADGTFRVVAVARDTAASRAHLKPGDVLVDIDGRPLARMDAAQIRTMERSGSIRYTVRSADGSLRSVTLDLDDLLPRRTRHGSTGSP